MCDSATQQLIEKFTLEKVGAGESFTAYDITKAVRNKVGRGTPVSHSDVRQEVHSLYENGQLGTDYGRSLCNLTTLPAGQNQPWVYHKNGVDLSAYGLGSHQPVSVGGSVIVVPQATHSAPVLGSGDDEDGDDGAGKQANGSFKVDGRATLCVPAKLVRELGLKENDECFAFADPLSNTVLLYKDQTPAGGTGPLTFLTSYTVNCNDNVRITQSALQRAGIPGNFYDIAGDKNRVVVKLFSTN